MDTFLRQRRVPLKLRRRVGDFFKHQWDQCNTPHHKLLFERLPGMLGEEVSLVLKRRLIEQVPMFMKLAPRLILALVRRLASVSAMPKDVIIHEGDDADSMFFISQSWIYYSC